jgi:multiple antibiotic resistance protein
MSISMLHARISGSKHTAEEAKEATEKESVSVVPLGIPLLAGPGAISTIIICAHYAPTWTHRLVLAGILMLVAFIVWIVLRLASSIGDAIGATGINIGTRLMGLILAAVAVEFISQGLTVLFPVLKG